MPSISSTSNIASLSVTKDTTRINNYCEILDHFQVHYNSLEYYWQVGKPAATCEWILNLTVIKDQLLDLLMIVVPFLLREGVPFKIIRDESIAESSLEGNLDYHFLGKMISVYPPTSQSALMIAKDLIVLTKSFKGPAIRTDHFLGGTVYTSLKTHITAPFSIPPSTIWPFREIVQVYTIPKSTLLNFSYYPTSILKADTKGDVIKALYFKKFWSIKYCVIKQGRANMCIDLAGRDMRDRLQWQNTLHTQLSPNLPLPKIIDQFTKDGDSYLVMQFINGTSFANYLNKSFDMLSLSYL